MLSSPPAIKAPTEVATPATINFAKSGKGVTCTQDDFILDIADQAEVAIESSCRSGTCGSCKCTLLEGEVSYDGEPDALDDRDRASNQILTCIARPVGHIVLDA
ncbi:MAG: 2Fe-2S iron-sulfur cluster-binding protein [Leptolyngbya sp. Prado105]|nr:2Fe-2S iron-sulfur cluster-binding protein [Leptolyngbya sp. Prado105]